MNEIKDTESAEVKQSRADLLAQKIAAKEKQLAELKAKKKQLEARARSRESAQARKNEARRKILVGAMVLNEAERNHSLDELTARLDAFLTRDDERSLFGLPARQKQQ